VENISLLTKDIPYIGGIFNTITGGIPTGSSDRIKEDDGSFKRNINGLISTHFLEFSKKDMGADAGYLNSFFPKGDNDKLSASNCLFAFSYNLTGVIDQPNDDGTYTTIDTAYLGTGYIPSTDA
jgi:hypothetical protein